jgi:hypothetical protein
MRKNQEEKDRVETQESKKGQNAVAAAGWRGSTNMPNSCTDVKPLYSPSSLSNIYGWYTHRLFFSFSLQWLFFV